MKKLLIVILLLIPALASAQIESLINRVDKQTGELGLVVRNPALCIGGIVVPIADTTVSLMENADTVLPLAKTEQSAKSVTGPKISAIYPSPLIQGASIKVKISSPKETTLSYSIYDGIGRVVALGVTRQHINLGTNTITINSLDGLANGSYSLKISFGDGSSDLQMFQVLK
jgi:hypothetical protein